MEDRLSQGVRYDLKFLFIIVNNIHDVYKASAVSDKGCQQSKSNNCSTLEIPMLSNSGHIKTAVKMLINKIIFLHIKKQTKQCKKQNKKTCKSQMKCSKEKQY